MNESSRFLDGWRIRIVDVKTIVDESGKLSIIESGTDLPIVINRFFYIWETVANLPRGGHAHKELVQCFIAMHGSCNLAFDNGHDKISIVVDNPSKCLVVQPGYWLDISDFSDECVLMILASEHYREDDYIRDYNEFQKYAKAKDHDSLLQYP